MRPPDAVDVAFARRATALALIAALAGAGCASKTLKLATQKGSRAVYQKLDEEITGGVVGALDSGPLPDVLTMYYAGTDLYAHVAFEGPDVARRAYLHKQTANRDSNHRLRE